RITPDAKLTPCPYMPAVAGDLRTRSFADVWRTAPLLESLRAGALGGRCGHCEYREVCGGCRARAFAGSGDHLAEDASCAYQPAGGPLVRAEPGRAYGAAATATMPWDDDALARTRRMPSFVRGVVMSRIETYARRHGHARVTPAVMDEVRRALPVDFSKRLPFFARAAADTPGAGAAAGAGNDAGPGSPRLAAHGASRLEDL